MLYVYECDSCRNTFEVVKPASQYNTVESCRDCSSQLTRRVLFSPQLIINQSKDPYFNYGLGKMIYRDSDIKEHIKRTEGETGREIIEVGNDSLNSIKPKKIEFPVEEAVKAYRDLTRGNDV